MTLIAGRPVRRRGVELEAAILDAAWDQLKESGYPGFTFEAVAERAGTSRPVLYRRWSTRAELLRAAVRHHGRGLAVTTPDTGSLRGDLLAALSDSNRRRADFLVLLSASLGEFYGETGGTPKEVRGLLMAGAPAVMDDILARAVARGEADPAKLTPRVRSTPFDLYRHEVLMTLRPLPARALREIVDEVFLPLVRPDGLPSKA